ncbi:MAG: DNA polymerase III subunit alpha [Candidatus Omnitrophota bacterium]
MPHSEFIHLHVHTQYSLLDGACRIPHLLSLAKQYNMDSLAITDHGNMFGAMDFYLQAQKAGIKPIIGSEVYIAPGSRLEKSLSGIEEASYHLVLLAKDEEGYKNLMKLVSIGYLEGFYYRPRIDKEILSRYSKGLIGLSACLKGEIPCLLSQNRFNDALKASDDFIQILGKDNFYLELQENAIKEQKGVNQGLIKLARQLSIGLVATCDVHYLQQEDALSHDALLCVQTQATLEDPKRLRFGSSEFYFKSPQQMKELFKELPEVLENTREISWRCNLELDFSQIHLPIYEPPGGATQEEFLEQLCREGISKRFGNEFGAAYKERLEHEFRIIKEMGFTSYFLIVWDFIHYAKENNIPTGPGRGSAAGSLVSYLLEITDIDPIKYKLLFERFLNTERKELPDIDIDFCYVRRPEVINYVTQKYGRENVAQIITFGTMQARAVIRDVGRVMGISYADVDKLAKMIPPDPHISLMDALESENELKNLYRTDEQIKKLIEIALSLEGLLRHASVHAAGVVIADAPLTDYMPLFKSGDDQITTGFSMDALGKIGLLKVDFLGLRTLTVIQETANLIRQRTGKAVDIEKIDLTDAKTFKLLCSAQTMGIFQLESSGMRDLLRKLEPERFEDLIALLALYRPGPIGSGMLDDFIKRRHGKVAVRYDHKSLEPILKDTYGIIVYQEQVMQIASQLGGFTLTSADRLRRAMSKKIPEVMEEQRKNFILGCKNNGIAESTANKIFDLILYFSGYGFNRCVAGDTQIVDADSGKLLTVRELYEKKNLISTFGCDDNLKIKKKRITNIMNNGIKDVYKVTTSLGKELIVTANHPFLTIEGWKKLEDISKSEKIAVPRQIPFVGNEQMQPHKLIVLAGILSEGNTCHPSGVYYYNNDILQVEDFVENLKRFENTEPTVSMRRGRYEVYAGTGKVTKFFANQIPWNKGITKKEYLSFKGTTDFKKSGVRLWIEKLGLEYKKATEKFIPSEIFSLTPENIALFLGRLWTGDGFIFSENNAIPFYATSSKTFAYQLQTLLLRFGIIGRVAKKMFRYRYKEKESLKEGFVVYLQGDKSIKVFLERICPNIINRDKKIEKLRSYYNRVAPESESKDVVPAAIKFLVREEKAKLNLSWRDLEKDSLISMREFYGNLKSYKKGFRRSTLKRLAEYLESSSLLKYATSEVYWDSIESIDYVGKEQTYDLEVEGIHNFIANGIIVHNSHSAAYAMISYRTAYLKANYPVEFMTALLTSERDNTDKVVEYVNEAAKMGINILPPDINTSEAEFKIADEKNIRFGLLAIKNLGSGAIESVVEARNKGGEFSNLEDFASRVDLRLVNRKVIESLIKAGTMDSLGMNRATMMGGLDKVLNLAYRVHKEKASGQLSFFDLGESSSNGFSSGLGGIPEIKEWPEPQLLAFEKDMLGFYLSGHPLARYAKHLARFRFCSTAELKHRVDGQDIKVVGLIVKVKQTVTRAKGEKMAILKLEDLEGIVEVLIFPQTYKQVAKNIQPNSIVLVKGKLNLKEDAPKIIADGLMIFDDIYRLVSGINIDISGIRENLFDSLKTKLLDSSGRVPIYLNLDTPSRSRVQLVVGEEFFVEPNEELIDEIESLLGEGRVSLVL